MAELQNLAYIVIGASDLAAWKSFGSDIVGAGVAALAPGSLGLRLDAHPWRLLIEQNDEDDLTHAGWDLGSLSDLDDYVATLRDRGADVREESPDRAEQRCVKRLFSLADPLGFVHEFFAERTGLIADGGSLSPILRGPGFRIDDLGIGHILPVSKDYDQGVQWYREILGLRYSDRIRQEMAPGIYADATFFHTATGRHHSLATGAFPSPKRLNHVMLEYRDMNDVGLACDRAKKAGIPIVLELGHHPNDQMFSFYMRTPSGFGLELGYGGVVIDEATWEPQIYDVMSDWGHARNMTMVN
ncbi:MAG: VOC family protein [Sphingobium sp.]|jgi:2,3-dihydroxybiphenyl 1,2-dioxygenase|nr:VOC family protein [Sphingobium sp.]MCI1270223.1 VOC family protein [Sphingobium sp.]MCI1757268.1 VOC family protein [Sphingobium sp.]MCI2053323.1 VOC family protein [Sphingobium sp.]